MGTGAGEAENLFSWAMGRVRCAAFPRSASPGVKDDATRVRSAGAPPRLLGNGGIANVNEPHGPRPAGGWSGSGSKSRRRHDAIQTPILNPTRVCVRPRLVGGLVGDGCDCLPLPLPDWNDRVGSASQRGPGWGLHRRGGGRRAGDWVMVGGSYLHASHAQSREHRPQRRGLLRKPRPRPNHGYILVNVSFACTSTTFSSASLFTLHLFENYKKKTKGSASRLSMSQAFGIEFFVYLTPKTILENKL